MQNNSAIEILNKIKTSKNILINMDTRTDRDALSSATVMHKFVDSLGIKVRTIHANKIKVSFYSFFSHEHIETETDINSIDLTPYDLIIFLDSGLISHISADEKFEVPSNIDTINIDHHLSNDMFGKMNYVHHLGSCCSVLYKFFNEINFPISKEYLDILAVGFLTDTGFLRFQSTTAEDFKMAAAMTEQGVKLWDIISKIMGGEYIDQIRFKELVYRNTKFYPEKRFAYSTIKLKELNDAKINMEKVTLKASVLINDIMDCDFCFVVTEKNTPEQFNLSFRSKPEFDVNAFAKMFGGGGHKNAAGADVTGVSSVEEAVETVINKLGL